MKARNRYNTIEKRELIEILKNERIVTKLDYFKTYLDRHATTVHILCDYIATMKPLIEDEIIETTVNEQIIDMAYNDIIKSHRLRMMISAYNSFNPLSLVHELSDFIYLHEKGFYLNDPITKIDLIIMYVIISNVLKGWFDANANDSLRLYDESSRYNYKHKKPKL